jgi:hypothetical protein
LLRVPSTGGRSAPATTFDPAIRTSSHRFPHFLPDGRHFLYLVWSGQVERQGLYVGSIDSTDTTRLAGVNSSAAYAPPGYLLFVRDETLMAQAFDAENLTLTGHAFSVATGVAETPNMDAPFSVSARGGLAYHAVDRRSRLVWFTRSGRELESLALPLARRGNPAISRDGHQILWNEADPLTRTADIFRSDERGNAVSRLTFDPSVDVLPVWSADATQVVFRSNRNGPGDLYRKSLTGTQNEELLLKNSARKDPTDWSPDGRFILYDNFAGDDTSRVSDMWVLPVIGDRQPSPYQRKTFSAWGGRFSPDGRWVAYAADETGKENVYIQAFPANGVSYRVSTGGGSQPTWRRDGLELIYLAADGMLMACAIRTRSNGVDVSVPTALFRPSVQSGRLRNGFDVAPDADRLVVNAPVQDETTAPITVLLNWTSTLRR